MTTVEASTFLVRVEVDDRRQRDTGGGGLLAGHPLEGEQHVLGGDVLAVVEGDALAQLDRPGLGVGRGRHRLGDGGLDLVVVVPVEQRLVELEAARDVGVLHRTVGVEGVLGATAGGAVDEDAAGCRRHRRRSSRDAAGVEERGSADSSCGDAGVLEDLRRENRAPSGVEPLSFVIRTPPSDDANLKWPHRPRQGVSTVSARVSAKKPTGGPAGPDNSGAPLSSSRVQSVDRAVSLLRAVADAGRGGAATVALGESCGLNRATAWRLLSTLETHGLVVSDRASGRWSLGPGLVDIARSAGSDVAAARRARGARERRPADR